MVAAAQARSKVRGASLFRGFYCCGAPELDPRWVRPESISRCSRIPKHRWSGSTSAEPQAPTAPALAAAAPTPARAPRVPSPPDHFGLPDLASHGSDSSPSRRLCPIPRPIDHLGTSDCWAQGPGPPERRGRQLARNRTTRKRLPPARCQTAESIALTSPSLKNFPWTAIKQSVIPTFYSSDPMNTGFEPLAQGPVYIDYSPSGAGTTVFDCSPT